MRISTLICWEIFKLEIGGNCKREVWDEDRFSFMSMRKILN